MDSANFEDAGRRGSFLHKSFQGNWLTTTITDSVFSSNSSRTTKNFVVAVTNQTRSSSSHSDKIN